jgi:hypothetical protein
MLMHVRVLLWHFYSSKSFRIRKCIRIPCIVFVFWSCGVYTTQSQPNTAIVNVLSTILILLCISQFQQCPLPRSFAAFPNPGGGVIAEIVLPGGGDFDVFHHGDWRTITWQITLEKILNSFANGLILILWDGLSVPLSLIIDAVKSFVYMK